MDDENFFKLFKIHSNHRKILQSTSDEVKTFSQKLKAFDEARRSFHGKDLADLVFEFQACMTNEIVEAQKRMSKKNNFTFYGDGAANEAGHVANTVNQLRMMLYDIRTECLGYQSEHGVSELRKCPHCGLIWTKVEGCEGETTCGNRPSAVSDFRDPSYAELGNFTSVRGAENPCYRKDVLKECMDVEDPLIGNQWQQWRFHLSSAKRSTSHIKTLPPTAANFRHELCES